MSCDIIMSHSLRMAWSQVDVCASSALSVSQSGCSCAPSQPSHLSCTLHVSANRPTLTSKCLRSTKCSCMFLVAGEACRTPRSNQSICVAKAEVTQHVPELLRNGDWNHIDAFLNDFDILLQ